LGGCAHGSPPRYLGGYEPRFMESSNLLVHSNWGHERGLLPLIRPLPLVEATFSPKVGGEGSCGGRFMESSIVRQASLARNTP